MIVRIISSIFFKLSLLIMWKAKIKKDFMENQDIVKLAKHIKYL